MRILALLLLLALPVAANAQPVTVGVAATGGIDTSDSGTVTNTSAQLVSAVLYRRSLMVMLNTSGACLALNPGINAAVMNVHPSITICGQGAYINFAQIGIVPNSAVQAICSITSCDVSVWTDRP